MSVLANPTEVFAYGIVRNGKLVGGRRDAKVIRFIPDEVAART